MAVESPHTPVVNIFMPFATMMYPSLALSLFKTKLKQMGVSSKTLYFNIRFAQFLGIRNYFDISEQHIFTYGNFLGEWLFSGQVWDQPEALIDEYRAGLEAHHSLASKFSQAGLSEDSLVSVMAARAQAARFLDACVTEIASHSPRVVGFSSMFQQHMASLALAKRLKAAHPDVLIVFGGANCEKMRGIETIRTYPFVDAVILGEGDLVYPEIIRRTLSGEPLDGMPGVYLQNTDILMTNDTECIDAEKVTNLDDLPFPDFSEYLSEIDTVWPVIEAIPNRFLPRPHLLLETSRGCWWKKGGGCNFCCHSESQTFRKKSAERFYDELSTVSTLYRTNDIWMTDSAMPVEYFRTLMPLLAERKPGVNLTYYIRVNMDKVQIQTLKEAGITRIMPGIESFSDHVLKVMNKGSTALQNVQVLKWCREFDIDAGWNYLWGAPGEAPGDYEEVIDLLPLITHLQPPYGFSNIYLGRFSNYHARPEEFGIRDMVPIEAYRHIYGQSGESIARFATAYRFSADLQSDVYIERLTAVMESWRNGPKRLLFLVDDGCRAFILDTRPIARQSVFILDSLQRSILLACNETVSMEQIVAFVTTDTGGGHTAHAIEQEVNQLTEWKLLIRRGNYVLALPVIAGMEIRGRLIKEITFRISAKGAELSPPALERMAVKPPLISALIEPAELFHAVRGFALPRGGKNVRSF